MFVGTDTQRTVGSTTLRPFSGDQQGPKLTEDVEYMGLHR